MGAGRLTGQRPPEINIPRYRVGFVFTRCFLQKRLNPREGLSFIPLSASGSAGMIHDARRALGQGRFAFNRRDLDKTLLNFSNTGSNVLVEFAVREAASFEDAIDTAEPEADAAASALAVVTANPAVPLVAFAEGLVDSGLKFYAPKDRQIRHGTNIGGFLDAVPALEEAARRNPKLNLLLRLYRASLREPEVDNQLLFQLILLEEASDDEPGPTLAERLRSYASRYGLLASFSSVASQIGVQLPPGRDGIDLVVALRNAAAHNGAITEPGLRQYRADWAIPLLQGKTEVHRFVSETLRVLFCMLVGYGPDKILTKISEPTEIQFD